jgi:hypothetical protein
MMSFASHFPPTPPHGTSRQERLAGWQEWLLNGTLPPRKRVVEVLQHGHLPETLLHQFACDCAEKVSEYSLHLSGTERALCKEAIQQKRIWLEGQTSHQTLVHYQEQLAQQLDNAHIPNQREHLLAVSRALHDDPLIASRYASRALRSEAEQEWQCSQLHAVIHRWLAHRRHFLALLQKRKVQLNGTLDHWKQAYENTLF